MLKTISSVYISFEYFLMKCRAVLQVTKMHNLSVFLYRHKQRQWNSGSDCVGVREETTAGVCMCKSIYSALHGDDVKVSPATKDWIDSLQKRMVRQLLELFATKYPEPSIPRPIYSQKSLMCKHSTEFREEYRLVPSSGFLSLPCFLPVQGKQ